MKENDEKKKKTLFAYNKQRQCNAKKKEGLNLSMVLKRIIKKQKTTCIFFPFNIIFI